MIIDTHIFLWWLFDDWDIPHRDPFDRILAAQSKIEDLTLGSIDKAMTLFPIKLAD